MERCLCCNARLKGAVICPRCQADLSTVISSEHVAQFWFSKTIQYWLENKMEQSLTALALSLRLKKIKLAVVFRGFLIEQLCQEILDLLAQKQLLAAKQRLYTVRGLFSHSQQLQQLNMFADYLLLKNP